MINGAAADLKTFLGPAALQLFKQSLLHRGEKKKQTTFKSTNPIKQNPQARGGFFFFFYFPFKVASVFFGRSVPSPVSGCKQFPKKRRLCPWIAAKVELCLSGPKRGSLCELSPSKPVMFGPFDYFPPPPPFLIFYF